MIEEPFNNDWKDVLQKLAEIREKEEYSAEEVEFIRQQLQSTDNRVRGGAALAACGCVFEPFILDLLIEMAQSGEEEPIRKASIQSLGEVINEGVMRSFEDNIGANTDLEFFEEWDELQLETLQEDYLRVKNLLLSIVEDDSESRQIREAGLLSLSHLGFLLPVQEIIRDFLNMKEMSSQLVALHAMGKYPQFWIKELYHFIDKSVPKSLLMEAISSSYSSNSSLLAKRIESLLPSDDPDIVSYALLTLANINKTENLIEILQKFSHSDNKQISQAARDALENLSRINFSDYMEKELGIEE